MNKDVIKMLNKVKEKLLNQKAYACSECPQCYTYCQDPDNDNWDEYGCGKDEEGRRKCWDALISRIEKNIPIKIEKTEDMTFDEFWGIVDSIGWGIKTTDYEMVKSSLQDKWSLTYAKRVYVQLRYFRNRLYRRFKFWDVVSESDVFGCSDDMLLNDLIYHIIGLGKDEYRKVTKNPEIAGERLRNNNYERSFLYCIPYEEGTIEKNL